MIYKLFFHVAITEIRLTLRNFGFWVYLFSIALITSGVLISTLDNDWLKILIQITNNALFFQFPLLAIVISSTVTRNQSRSREWIWATQLDYPSLFIGQLLGLIVIFSVASLTPLIVTSVWFLLKNPNFYSNLPTLWGFGLSIIVPVTFLEISIAFSFACWIRNTIFSVGSVIALSILVWLGILMPSASLLTPLNYTLLTLHLDTVAGLGAEKIILVNLLIFYILLGISASLASIWGSAQILSYGEFQPKHKSYMVLGILIGFMGVSLSLWGYASSVRQSVIPLHPSSSQINVWGVEDASHIGSISDAEISLKSEFTLRNISTEPQNILTLALNTGEHCKEAIVNNQPILCKQQGEVIELQLLPLSVKPGEEISLQISYGGSPILLREDYSLVSTVRGYSPPSFQNPVQTYFDRNVIYLHRDGDWLIWPLSKSPHISSHDAISIKVLIRSPMISSGRVIEQTETHITYLWEGNLPQILLVSAPYQMIEQSGSNIFLGHYSDGESLDEVQTVLSLVRILEHKVGLKPKEHYKVVMLPYVQEMVMSESIIGLSTESINRNFSDKKTWVYSLAQDISLAWLIDQIAWPKEITTNGYLRNSETICDEPDETGYQKCETRSLGEYNLQAPQGRFIRKLSNNYLLDSLSTILTLQLSDDFNGNKFFSQQEYNRWSLIGECNDTTMILAPDEFQKARWIMAIHRLYDEIGTDRASQMLQLLIKKYPPGSLPLTDVEFLQFGSNSGYRMADFELSPLCSMSAGDSK